MTVKTETTGYIKRRDEDRVVPGERMRRCLELNKFALSTIARASEVSLYAVRAAYRGATITRWQWRRIAASLRLPV